MAADSSLMLVNAAMAAELLETLVYSCMSLMGRACNLYLRLGLLMCMLTL